ncbi:hypothetical protein MKK88_02475 [Methylobacterium sp. E-005]|uniref:hypothetical protein n=1 Tax=Methylobacterium sp. E-005 TaxID=2836549 RepID=UPI001FBBC5E1|nr:hypothetical protein [Methylobacterium sp. E-005]MCJ2084859.1 hypothetical protein [Methylobacterium sp. E-005]
MSKPPRPKLSSLSDRLAPKSTAAAARPASADETSEASQEPEAAPASPTRAPATEGPRDFKTMMCRVNRAGWQEMSRLAIDRDRNLEDLIIEACNDLLVREGFSPVIEKRSPTRR